MRLRVSATAYGLHTHSAAKLDLSFVHILPIEVVIRLEPEEATDRAPADPPLRLSLPKSLLCMTVASSIEKSIVRQLHPIPHLEFQQPAHSGPRLCFRDQRSAK
jgi:hypothetical protein